MHRTLGSVLLIGVLLVAVTATEAQPRQHGPRRGRPAVKPKIDPGVMRLWAALDTNKDGKIDKAEFAKAAPRVVAALRKVSTVKAPAVKAPQVRRPQRKAPQVCPRGAVCGKGPAARGGRRPQVGFRGMRGWRGPVARQGRGRMGPMAQMARRRGMRGRGRGLVGRRPMFAGRFGARRQSFGRGSRGRGPRAGRGMFGRCPMMGGQRGMQQRRGFGRGGFGQRGMQQRRGFGRGGFGQRGMQQRRGFGRGGFGQRGMQQRRGFGRGGFGQWGRQGMTGRMMMWRKMLGGRLGQGRKPQAPKVPSFGRKRGGPGAMGQGPSFGWGGPQRGQFKAPKPAGPKPQVRSRLRNWHDQLSDEQKAKMKAWVEAMKKRAQAWGRGQQKPQTPKKPVVRRPAPRKPAPKKPAPQQPSMHRPRGEQRRGPGQGGQQMGGRLFHFMRTKDKNQDRKLDLKEFGDEKKFKALDKDKDGFLSLRELFGAMGGPQRR